MHTTDAQRTIARLVSVFEATEQAGTRLRLAESLRAVISQRLLPRKDGNGRVVAVEVMRNTATIADCIGNPERSAEIRDHISQGREQYGMQTFDQHLMELYTSGSALAGGRARCGDEPGGFRAESGVSVRGAVAGRMVDSGVTGISRRPVPPRDGRLDCHRVTVDLSTQSTATVQPIYNLGNVTPRCFWYFPFLSA